MPVRCPAGFRTRVRWPDSGLDQLCEITCARSGADRAALREHVNPQHSMQSRVRGGALDGATATLVDRCSRLARRTREGCQRLVRNASTPRCLRSGGGVAMNATDMSTPVTRAELREELTQTKVELR